MRPTEAEIKEASRICLRPSGEPERPSDRRSDPEVYLYKRSTSRLLSFATRPYRLKAELRELCLYILGNDLLGWRKPRKSCGDSRSMGLCHRPKISFKEEIAALKESNVPVE